MKIIDEIFATIKPEILVTIKVSENPYQAARTIAERWQLHPSTAKLLLKGIEEIFNENLL